MKRILTLLVIVTATAAGAQSLVTGVGSAKAIGSNNIRVTSFNKQWTVQPVKAADESSLYAIFDQQNHTLFTWGGETLYHEAVTVSFSPDSSRVVVMDQQPQAPQFFCAVLDNGQWHAVRLGTDPKMPQYTDVTKAELGNWISPTEVKLTVKHLAANKWVKYTTTLSFSGDSVNFAAN